MKRYRQISLLGILFLCVSQTGCGVLNGFTGAARSTKVTNKTTNKGARITRTVSPSSTTHKISGIEHSLPPYPSFGLDVTGPEVLALNERLAELGYLPLAVNATTQPNITLANLESPTEAPFKWRYGNVPSQLSSQWSADTYTEMTRAAVIAVEHANNLPIDGIVGEEVWKAILGANALKNPNPYTYVLVKKSPAPEDVRVWRAGKWVYQCNVNTGVAGAQTTDGTFAVYERFLTQTMKGTNPNGTRYDDPNVRYVNYFNGSEAIHGFPRASYGFPQSNGCVELPISNAKIVWSLIHYGSLVTVEGHYVPLSSKGTQSHNQRTALGNTASSSASASTTTDMNGRGARKSSELTNQSSIKTAGSHTNNTTSSNNISNSTASPAANTTSNTTGDSNTTRGNSTNSLGNIAINPSNTTGERFN